MVQSKKGKNGEREKKGKDLKRERKREGKIDRK
jgi:hypothetical protein